MAIVIFFIVEARRKRSLEQQEAANDKERKEAAERYERLQKNSESLQQQIKRLEKNLKRDIADMLENGWKTRYPGQPFPPGVRTVLRHIAETTVGLPGAAGTMVGGPEGGSPLGTVVYSDPSDDPDT
ncbi:MAG TPA: hypothetical protein ENI27_01205 [bacterium]|nr:hypothetical protein [bacterium]